MKNIKIIDKELVEKYLYCCESSPSGLRWKEGNNATGMRKPHDVAGYLSNTGYYSVEILGKAYRAHRIVMLLNGYDINNKVVDHLDKDKTNNKISNLRIVDQAVNSRNQKIRSSNTTGVMGVHPFRRNGVIESYVASWYFDGKLMKKSFSLKQYGDDALKVAAEFRSNKIKELNQLGYGYTDTHGQ